MKLEQGWSVYIVAECWNSWNSDKAFYYEIKKGTVEKLFANKQYCIKADHKLYYLTRNNIYLTYAEAVTEADKLTDKRERVWGETLYRHWR